MKPKGSATIYTMHIGDEVTLTIGAGERYSLQRIAVRQGEVYTINCHKSQRWYDLIIPASPDGYNNFIAPIFGLRVKDAKCFCLCGAWNENDQHAFTIGTEGVTAIAPAEGRLSFFANDVWGYEWNNWGSIQVKVMRTM
jgi:hypothetical protein